MNNRNVASPLVRCALGLVFLPLFASASFASVIYEFQEVGSTTVIGTLEIKTPPASTSSGWSTTELSDLLALLLDDAEFGLGSGNLLSDVSAINVEISSLDGSKLDSGGIQIDFPTIFPTDPADPTIDYILVISFDMPAGEDFVAVAGTFTFPNGQVVISDLEIAGDWTAAPDAAVPEPGTLALLGVGLLTAARSARHRRRPVKSSTL
jgi:hypothetical protein